MKMDARIKAHMDLCANNFCLGDVPDKKDIIKWTKKYGTPYEDNSEADFAARTYHLLNDILEELTGKAPVDELVSHDLPACEDCYLYEGKDDSHCYMWARWDNKEAICGEFRNK